VADRDAQRPSGIAVVGLGYWGPGIVRNFKDLQHARVLHLVDRAPERAAAVAARHAPDAAAHADLDRALADPDVGALVVATPVRSHFDLSRRALLAGKHVLVEKPLAMSVAEGRELQRLAASRGLVLMVGHIFRFNAAVDAVRACIDAGDLGDLLYVHSRRVNLGRVQADVNALWSFAPHDFSILNHWLRARPISVQARGFSYIQDGVEDVVFCTVEYPGGVGAHLHLGWLDPRKVREMTVVGTKRMAVFDDVSVDAKVQVFDSRIDPVNGWSGSGAAASASRTRPPESFADWQGDVRHGDVTIPRIQWVEPLRAEVEHFLDCVRNGVACRTAAGDGIDVVAAIVAAVVWWWGGGGGGGGGGAGG
jgi:predicted dehydrogenase